jgi:hypothetical protein
MTVGDVSPMHQIVALPGPSVVVWAAGLGVGVQVGRVGVDDVWAQAMFVP